MINKPGISKVGIKFITTSDVSIGELKVANIQIQAWEELTFNLTVKIGAPSSSYINESVIFNAAFIELTV